MLKIDLLNFFEKHRRTMLVAQDVSDRRRDVAVGKNSGRHLVQERLEEMVVVPIHYGDVNVSAPQNFGWRTGRRSHNLRSRPGAGRA